MYNLNDTIVAVSSACGGTRSIVRITGPATIEICQQIFESSNSSLVHHPSSLASRLISGRVIIDDDLDVDAVLYLFFAPHSYTGDDVAEIHIFGNTSIIEVLVGNLLCTGKDHVPKIENRKLKIENSFVRMAGPGEFAARAYLNGKIDLAQAEAVNEIVVGSNTFQIAAAQKLLGGRLGQAMGKMRCYILDCLSLLEAELDFSEETIEFTTKEETIGRLSDIKEKLLQLLIESNHLESMIDLPAVGIAGSPNAGKSSLLNKLLGWPRSIVSAVRKTTRDVLAGELTLRHCRCVLFDCAGLVTKPESVLDELTQQAAIEALRNSSAVIFCVDISKEDWSEDISVQHLINKRTDDRQQMTKERGEIDGRPSSVVRPQSSVIPAVTKCDLVPKKLLADRISKLKEIFGYEFFSISAKTGTGLESLRDTIDKKLVESFQPSDISGLALTSRHRQAVAEAIENIESAVKELAAGRDEVAAMMLRAALLCISDIEQAGRFGVDEQILQKIFSRFCIGK